MCASCVHASGLWISLHRSQDTVTVPDTALYLSVKPWRSMARPHDSTPSWTRRPRRKHSQSQRPFWHLLVPSASPRAGGARPRSREGPPADGACDTTPIRRMRAMAAISNHHRHLSRRAESVASAEVLLHPQLSAATEVAEVRAPALAAQSAVGLQSTALALAVAETTKVDAAARVGPAAVVESLVESAAVQAAVAKEMAVAFANAVAFAAVEEANEKRSQRMRSCQGRQLRRWRYTRSAAASPGRAARNQIAHPMIPHAAD